MRLILTLDILIMSIISFDYDRLINPKKDKVDLLEKMYIISVSDLVKVEGNLTLSYVSFFYVFNFLFFCHYYVRLIVDFAYVE